MQDQPLTIAQILGALQRHKFKAGFVWLLVMSVVVVLFLIWPRQYSSEGGLYVQMGRNNTPVTPNSGSSSVTVQDTRETEILSVVEIIKSPAVTEAVVDEIGAEEILATNWPDVFPKISLPDFSSRGNQNGDGSMEDYDQLKKRELAIKHVEGSMSVNSEKKTSIITVYVKAGSPKLAQKLVKSIFKHAQKMHLKVHAAEGSKVFFEEEMNKHLEQVARAERELAQYRDSIDVISVEQERATVQGILTTLENDIVKAEIDVAESTERLENLTVLLARTEAQIAVPTSGVERLSYEDSRTELFRIEAERERLIATYESDHPEVIRVEAQLKQLKKALEAMTEDRTESAMVSNPIYEEMQVDFLRAKVNHAASLARLKSLKQMEQELVTKRIPAMNRASIDSQKLERNIEIAKSDLFIYSQKRGETQAMSALDERNISDLKVLLEPNYRVKHISPRGSLVIPFGFLCGLMAALVTAMFFDRNHLGSSLNEGDVEQAIGLPVLVTLPRVYASRNMVN